MSNDVDKELLDALGTEFSSGKGVEMYESISEKLTPLVSKYNLEKNC